MQTFNSKRGIRRVASIATAAAAVGGSGIGLIGLGAETAAAAPTCVQAGNSGFTAAVVARAGQHISGEQVDATGCDVGIYVGPGATGVQIRHVKVTGANDAGILVQKTSRVMITGSTVTGNGFHSPGQNMLPQAFGISLFGVSDSVVSGNTVYSNARGGIGVMDYGPFDPGQLVTHEPGPATPLVPSDHDVVSDNRLWANYNACAIVLAPFNQGGHVADDIVTGNTITGVGANQNGADVGAIVVQSNGPASTVRNITIGRNRVSGSTESGVIVHAAAPNSRTSDIWIAGNVLSGDNWAKGAGSHPSQPDQLTGIVVDSLLEGPDGARAVNTVVTGNQITDEFYGVWSRGADAPYVWRNSIDILSGGTPVYRVAS